MEDSRSSLRFIDYYVNKVEFYNNESFDNSAVKIDFKVSRDIEYLEDEDNTFYVTLNANVFEDAEKNNYPFTINLSLTGIFELNDEDVHNKESFAEINSVAILFPYLRSIISTYTANANISPLILPPINVINMIEKENSSK